MTRLYRCQPGPIRDKILAAFDADPLRTSYQIASVVDTDAKYVRQILQRHGRKLARKRGHRSLQ